MELEAKTETDFSIQLKGSTQKLVKCLDLLQIIVTSNRLVIAIDKLTVQRLALTLYGLFSQHTLSEQCLSCLLEIFKRNHELALPVSTSLFIEINCNLESQNNQTGFISFLIYWLKIVKHLKLRRPILHFGVLQNYIRRIPHLTKSQV